mgnify:FL=1
MTISLIDVGKTYGKDETQVQAVKPCSFTIRSGEQIAITGASGSGKSTLLHLIGALDKPSWGTRMYDGKDVADMSENKLAGFRLKNIGFVFQAYNLLPELSAYENIILPALLDGRKIDKEYVNDIVKRLELWDRLNHMPGQLSGGQQQRVAIARALINKPAILLCDEPTGNLDSKNSQNVINLLNETAKAYNLSLVIVTHNEAIAKQYPRIINIADGEVGGDINAG